MTGEETLAAWRHVAPFLAWVLAMNLPMGNLALRYAIQVLATVLTLAWVRPWRYYSPVTFRVQPLAILVGVAVFLIWIGAEKWTTKSAGGPSPYAPEQCGWLLTAVRLAGSAFVIATAEEFFWRGFFLRWMQGRPFTAIDPVRIGWGVLILVSLIFGLEHSARWLVGMLAGVAYGLLYIRTRDLGAAITAHITTNFLLGLYVLATGSYGFW